jgi:hypothetical protein
MVSIFVIPPHCRHRVRIAIIFIVFEENVTIMVRLFMGWLGILVDGLHVGLETFVFCLFFDKNNIIRQYGLYLAFWGCKLCFYNSSDGYL